MHEVYIAMELTIYIFNFNPSINKVVYCASKKKSIARGGIRTRTDRTHCSLVVSLSLYKLLYMRPLRSLYFNHLMTGIF